MRVLLAVFAVLLTATASAQFVQIGPSDPHFCDKVETIAPNLHIAADVRISGRVTDIAGAPFKNRRVELRRHFSSNKQLFETAVLTDKDGNFVFRTVRKGEYRLLASPDRSFRQPSEMWCRADAECRLDITLQVNPTDLPESQCPIR